MALSKNRIEIKTDGQRLYIGNNLYFTGKPGGVFSRVKKPV
jgi:hypothetical protein